MSSGERKPSHRQAALGSASSSPRGRRAGVLAALLFEPGADLFRPRLVRTNLADQRGAALLLRGHHLDHVAPSASWWLSARCCISPGADTAGDVRCGRRRRSSRARIQGLPGRGAWLGLSASGGDGGLILGEVDLERLAGLSLVLFGLGLDRLRAARSCSPVSDSSPLPSFVGDMGAAIHARPLVHLP